MGAGAGGAAAGGGMGGGPGAAGVGGAMGGGAGGGDAAAHASLPYSYGGCSCGALTRVTLKSDEMRSLSWSHLPHLEAVTLCCPMLVCGW